MLQDATILCMRLLLPMITAMFGLIGVGLFIGIGRASTRQEGVMLGGLGVGFVALAVLNVLLRRVLAARDDPLKLFGPDANPLWLAMGAIVVAMVVLVFALDGGPKP